MDHFYEEENDEIPNVNMKIWQNALMEYTRLVINMDLFIIINIIIYYNYLFV